MTENATYCDKQTVGVSFGDESHEFNFSKFSRKLHEKELPSKVELIGLTSIVLPPTDRLEQYLMDHENDMNLNERNEIDKMFFDRQPILKHC